MTVNAPIIHPAQPIVMLGVQFFRSLVSRPPSKYGGELRTVMQAVATRARAGLPSQSAADRLPPAVGASAPYSLAISAATVRKLPDWRKLARVDAARRRARLLLLAKQAQRLAQRVARVPVLRRTGVGAAAAAIGYGGPWIAREVSRNFEAWQSRIRMAGLEPIQVTAKRIRAPRTTSGAARVDPFTPGRATSGRRGRGTVPRTVATAPAVKLEPIKVTAKRITVPATSSATTTARAISTGRALWAGYGQQALGVYAMMRAMQQQKAPAVPAPFTPTPTPAVPAVPAPIVYLQPQQAATAAQARAAARAERCPPGCRAEPRKRGTPRCRNPVVSRRKRTSDGRTLITITREQVCQP